jgi:adenylylsulfate kinase-like enzyme
MSRELRRMIPVLWVTGPPGVGKTAVAWEIYGRLQRAGADPAYVDVDQLGMCFPPLGEDPERHMLKARNVAALRANFAAAGARTVVVSGVADVQQVPDVDKLGGPHIGVARLQADPDELRARLRRRNGRLLPQRGSLEEHDGTVEVATALDRSSFANWCINTTGLSIDAVATAVLTDIADWPPVARARTASVSVEGAERAQAGGEVLWIAGPTGVGKSTVGYRAYLDVLRTGRRAAFIDVDQLGFARDGRSDPSLRSRNLAAMWSNFIDVGARLAVVVGCVSTRAEARLYEQALPNTRVSWCQLRIGAAELTRRVLSRGHGGSWAEPGDPLLDQPEEELLTVADRAIAASSLLDQHGIGLPVDVDALDVEDAAAKLLTLARWPTMKPTDPHSG